MWTLFVLNFDSTFCINAPSDSGVPPLVYLIPKNRVEDVKKYARQVHKDFWNDDDNSSCDIEDIELDESFEKYLLDNHIEFRVIGSIDITYGERKGNYLDKNIPTECI